MVLSRNSVPEIVVFLTFNRVKKRKILKTWSMTKKRSSEIFGLKMEIFSRKSVIQVREIFFVTPKLGARSPPLLSGREL